VVFGFWAMVLMVVMFALVGWTRGGIAYLDSRNFTEPMFVFAIMVIAGSRAVLQMAGAWCGGRALRAACRGDGLLLVTLAWCRCWAVFITEPAAMTLAALMLRDGCSAPRSRRSSSTPRWACCSSTSRSAAR
jgi:hypothetical protein